MKKHKPKTDREVLKQLFPKEIVNEVDAILEEVDAPPKYSNPSGRKEPKPWGRKWSESNKRRKK